MVADEYARPGAVKAGRVSDLEPNSGESKDVAKEPALRPVVFARINEYAEKDEKRADGEEVNCADDPKGRAAYYQPSPAKKRSSSAD
jgi:hypothetical protein